MGINIFMQTLEADAAVLQVGDNGNQMPERPAEPVELLDDQPYGQKTHAAWRHQPSQCPDLSGEEVGRHEDVHVQADKLFPWNRGLALRGRR